MPYRTLIGTDELAALWGEPSIVIVDCRFRLDNPSWGRASYLESHISGAVYADLDADLSGATTGTNGRHPLPDPDALARTLGRLGIGTDVQVVAYDQDNAMYASRLWWLVRWLGHDNVAVLDGGFARWLGEDRPTRGGDERNAPARFTGTPRRDMTVSADEVEAIRNDTSWKLIDARAPERFRGEIEPIDKAAGHIPGAVNLPYLSNVTEAGTFRPGAELQAAFDRVTDGVAPDHLVSYCGSGVTACHSLLALEHLGLHGAKLYPGSWSEWSSDPNRPVEK
jgi:thiosulfate/3-mercaptopyruvate sulfurtransferase